MTISRAEQINRDLRHRDWLIDQGVLSPTDSASSEARIGHIRMNALTCPECDQSVDASNWQKHFKTWHPESDVPELPTSTPPEAFSYRYNGEYANCKYCYTAHNKWEESDAGVWLCRNCGHTTHDSHMDLLDTPPAPPEPETTLDTEEQNPAIVRLDEARAMLAQLHNVDDVKAIRDKAEAMRVYARQAHLGLEAQNHAAEIKLRAERRAGELLREMEKNPGKPLKGRNSDGSFRQSRDATTEQPTLADLGISKSQSSRWQAIAALPEPEFERTIAETKSAEKELTTAHMLRSTTLGKQKPKTNRAGDAYTPQGFDACQTPPEALEPLLPHLKRDWIVWEPAAGENYLVTALRGHGFGVAASDLLVGEDFNFFSYAPPTWDCIVTNPPYSIKYEWLERCYELGKPFALLLPVETLGAKTAQELFREHGVEVVFMDRRINFKMPNKGWDGSSAQFPTAWFTWRLNLESPMVFARLKP